VSRKKGKGGRRPIVGTNPVARAVSGAAPLTRDDQGYTVAAKIQARQAALAFAEGRGTPADAARLASAFNVTALLIEAHAQPDANTVKLLTAWREAVRNLYLRADGRGGIGELAAVTDGLDLHDELLATVTLAEMTSVLSRLKQFALAGLLMEVPHVG